jgi:hypothetical protein
MNQIVIDDSASKLLCGAQVPCVLFNPAGRKLGYFTPALDPAEYDNFEPPISDEELRAAANEQGGRTLSDILADLEGRK